MPANVGFQYEKAEEEYHKAQTVPEKIKALQNMLSSLAKHKGNEKLQMEIKQKISKLKKYQDKEKKSSKRGSSLVIKHEGAARVVLIGKTRSGKSYLLSNITNAKPLIADYEFTTKKPEIGSMDYEGIKIQVIEIPAVTKNFMETDKGPSYLGIVRESDLVVILANNKEDEKFVKHELKEAGIGFSGLIVNYERDFSEIKEEIWNKLNLIYVYTKTPGKEKDFPPVALRKGASVKDLALKVHKDFIRKFNYARINGKSAKFENQQVGLSHKLQSGDVVELHLR